MTSGTDITDRPGLLGDTAAEIVHVASPRQQDIRPHDDAAASAAALRQFSHLRLMAYGLDPGDAAQLLELVEEGNSWKRTATALADRVLARGDQLLLSARSRAQHLHRASALLRISLAMDLDNNAGRRATYLRAAELFEAAHADDPRYEKALIDSSAGPIAAWLIRANPGRKAPVALVHGGVDGWSMDWEGLALSFVQEGIDALVVDGPGQGETRFRHEHYLHRQWLDAYEPVTQYLREVADGKPIAAVGNSMAAGMVLHIAARYPVFSAVSSNGPVREMSGLLEGRSYARKLATFCGARDVPDDRVAETFASIDLPEQIEIDCPFQLLQGTADPMVPVADGEAVLTAVRSPDKQFALFDGGEHVINRYPGDKHAVQSSWVAHHLGAS